jgi:Haem-degrading
MSQLGQTEKGIRANVFRTPENGHPCWAAGGRYSFQIQHSARACFGFYAEPDPCEHRRARRSIRRLLALSLHLCRFYPPHQIVGKARKRPFESGAAFTRRRTISCQGLSNGTDGRRELCRGPLVQPGQDLFPLMGLSGGRFCSMGGGAPLNSEGQLVAGVGVSGGTVEQDVNILESALRETVRPALTATS